MNSVYQCAVTAALRAEQLGRLNYLRRRAARGKLRAAIGWIEKLTPSRRPRAPELLLLGLRPRLRSISERTPRVA